MKILKSMMKGVMALALPLMFTACGNFDNPLEVISNVSPAKAFALKYILENNSTFVVNFKLNGENCSVTVVNKGNNNFVIDSYTGDIDPDGFGVSLTEDKKQVVLTRYVEAGSDEAESQIFFNPQDESFYILNNIGRELIFDGKVSVNDTSGTLTNSCPLKVQIDVTFGEDPPVPFIVNYKEGDTWQTVKDRYDNSDLSGLIGLGDDSKVKLKQGDYTGVVKYNDGDGTRVTSADVVGKKAGAAYDSNYIATLSAEVLT